MAVKKLCSVKISLISSLKQKKNFAFTHGFTTNIEQLFGLDVKIHVCFQCDSTLSHRNDDNLFGWKQKRFNFDAKMAAICQHIQFVWFSPRLGTGKEQKRHWNSTNIWLMCVYFHTHGSALTHCGIVWLRLFVWSAHTHKSKWHIWKIIVEMKGNTAYNFDIFNAKERREFVRSYLIYSV